jgi:hypothetical protein
MPSMMNNPYSVPQNYPGYMQQPGAQFFQGMN